MLTYFLNVILKQMDKIVNKILIFVILFFAQMLYLNHDFPDDKKALSRNYVPKSRQKWKHCIQVMTSCGRQLYIPMKPAIQTMWKFFILIRSIVVSVNKRDHISKNNWTTY